MSFSSVLFIFIALIVSVAAASLNILQIAPNFLDTNYALSLRFADLLATNSNYAVHFLVPLSKPSSAGEDKMPNHPNVHVQICHLSERTLKWMEQPPPDTLYMNPPPENTQIGGWSARHYTQSPAIAYVEGFEVIADIVRQQSCWEELTNAHGANPFNVGLMDIWDFGALALFHRLGIKNVVLTHNFPLMSHMFDYMTKAKWATESGDILDYKEQILANGVPELFSAVTDDENIGKTEAFSEKHKISSNIFSTVYKRADKEFQKLFNNKDLPALKKLFGSAKCLYVNTIPSLDYELGKLPKRVKFIGGIDLVPSHPEELKSKTAIEKAEKVIVFSMSSLLEPAKMPKDKFERIVKGLGQLEGMDVLWKYNTRQLEENHRKHSRNELLEKHAPNVHLADYDPSNFIGRKNTVLVISECDIRSAMNALSVQKPLLCMPMFAEQFYVAEKLRRESAAVVLDPRAETFTSHAIVQGIEECVHLPKIDAFKFLPEKALQKMILDDLAEIEKSIDDSVPDLD